MSFFVKVGKDSVWFEVLGFWGGFWGVFLVFLGVISGFIINVRGIYF